MQADLFLVVVGVVAKCWVNLREQVWRQMKKHLFVYTGIKVSARQQAVLQENMMT